ncbi:MAG: chromate transporter [Bacteroidales bacterium]|jgi:chromate transporter|nr:chromate transporter [Bacteroidales bacterium]
MPSLFQIFWSFFKIGSFTLGGGYAMVPLIQREVVDRKKWLPEKEFVEMLGLAQASPGPIALNTAIFVGYKTRGMKGIVSSSLGVILPSFIIILLIAVVFVDFKNNPVVERIFKGIRPAVVALIAAPLWKMGKTAGITLKTVIIPVTATLLVWLLHVSPVYVIIASIIGGVAYGVYQKNRIERNRP